MPSSLRLVVALLCVGCAPGVVGGCGTKPAPPPPPPADGGVSADGGGLAPLECTGQTIAKCAGECVNLDADGRHCGACGNACAQGGSCQFGVCQCPGGTAQCGAVCADLKLNSDHCGACGVVCDFGTACVGGACVEQCQSGLWKCGEACIDLANDPAHCGTCTTACTGGKLCSGGSCACAAGTKVCNGQCSDPQTDPQNCGACGMACFGGFDCEAGKCACPAGRANCGTHCADTQHDPNNCGGCNITCQAGQACVNGFCDAPCPTGWTKCNGVCVDPQTSASNCGMCGNSCGTLSCQGGVCGVCNSATADCDNDGWLVADGDCCDQPGCGLLPSNVNPGALEVVGDGKDNNCNGLVDAADTLDTTYCDNGLGSASTNANDYAKALGICRTTTVGATGAAKTWGLISAQLLHADGTPITTNTGHSIRGSFGSVLKPQEGRSFVLIASGAAADAVQTNPGPNGGPSSTSVDHNSSVDIQACTLPSCIKDWFAINNPPLKGPNQLPEAPGCTGGGFGVNFANDSVMLELTLRAPTNVKAFEFKGYFLSSEYAEYVCTTFNDQLIALLDTPNGAPIGAVNPVDKNLMTYSASGQQWPIGINVAHGTGLFKVCETQATNMSCWDTDVSSASCAKGASELAGTGFEMDSSGCTNGGGTGWLTTSGNIRPGDLVKLRIAIWDVGDSSLDSLAVLDGFKWLFAPATPGTTD